jgi:SAM-dependent methyltransferase
MPRLLAAAVVLVAAGVVLVLEILAVRLAAPYVGLTLETYSAAIGIALLGIAAGAWAGGQLADVADARSTLGPTLIVGGVLVLLARPIVDGLGPHLEDSGSLGTLAVVGAGTGPAILVLSMAHPAVVKLRLAALEHTGATVGGLSAVGTLGALGGTLLTGFVLLGELSTRDIALGAGVLVVGLGVAVSVALRRSGGHTVVIVLPALAVLPALTVLLANDGVCERETRYYCARVEAYPLGNVLWLDNLSHAYVNPARPQELLLEYLGRIEIIVDALHPDSQPLTVLHIGGGGFAYPNYLAAARPGTRSTVLELDPEVVEIAREELGLSTGPDLRVRTGDARMSILDEPSGAYDLVVGDAFSSRSVPWHLTTREFLAEVRRVLRPDGVYAMNLIDGGELGFLRAELSTLEAVFDNVVVVANRSQSYGNFVAAASPAVLPLEALRRRGAASGSDVIDAATLSDGAAILTDDFAPVDQLIGSTPGDDE